MNGKAWKPDEVEYLKQHYPHKPTKQVCEEMGKSLGSVYCQVAIMQLKKSEEFLNSPESGRRLKGISTGNVTSFTKGFTPWNKGKKQTEYLAPEQLERIKSTQFKKGTIPPNTKYDGHERLSKDGYVEIRVSKGKYVLKHRLVWQQTYGEVPKGMIVVFKDRNPQNIVPENLELITRQENMQRNTYHRFPPELKNAIRTLSKLKNYIHEKQN